MLISCRVKHILFAIQPTREKLIRILEAQKQYPEISFSTLVDNEDSLTLFSNLAETQNQKINLWLDINNGMNRTGVVTKSAPELYMTPLKEMRLLQKYQESLLQDSKHHYLMSIFDIQ